MKQVRSEERNLSRVTKTDSVCCKSALLLSIACCITLIHVELRMQEHDRLFSHPVTRSGQMETEIFRVQQKNERWRVTESPHSDLGQETEGEYWKIREQR